MCEEKIFRCPVCDSVLEFYLDNDNDLCCECHNCDMRGYDTRTDRPKSKTKAYLDFYDRIPLQFFLNKVAMRLQETRLQETNEILLSSAESYSKESDKLKPCPFCGSEHIFLNDQSYRDKSGMHDILYYECMDCGGRARCTSYISQAEKDWNRRVVWNRQGESDKLKSCPFCGNESIIFLNKYSDGIYKYVYYECKDCGARSRCTTDVNEAEKDWNKRVV